MRRRCFLPLAALAGCARKPAATGCAALAGQAIRWIVPYTPGGSYDVYSRLLERPLEQALGAELTISNEAGAGGALGTARIRDAAPDGRTLGILNMPALLAGGLTPGGQTPDPVRDFTVLGRVARSWSVLATGPQSGLRTLDDLVARSRVKPLVFGTTGAASNTFMTSAIAADLLGLRTQFVSGYGGAREEMLAVMRGEVDLLSANYETLLASIEAGELRPIVALAGAPLSQHPNMANCGLLAGGEGWAARRATASGRTRAQAIEDAQALLDTVGAGMVAVGPKGVAPETAACLQTKFLSAASSPEFSQAAQAARRTLDVAGNQETVAGLEAASRKLRRFAPIVQAAVERIRR